MRRGRALGVVLALTLAGQALAGAIRPGDFRLIGALELPATLAVDDAPFGGISGADYDPRTGEWRMISDDKSAKAPARFYVGRLDFDATGVRGLALERQVSLRRADGSTFPATSGRGERADAEALRIDPRDGGLVWSTEGDPERGFDPAVRRMDREGAPKGEIPLPAGLGFDPAKTRGARWNQTVEGLSFSPDGRSLWVSMEAPLVQDGPASTVSRTGAARITRIDRAGRVLGQYAYPLDPVQAAPVHRGDNGISEILAVDARRLLVLERSGVEDARGRFVFHCRLYEVDTRGADDVAGRESLAAGVARPLAKRLLVNFDRLSNTPASNLEAMAWGPDLPGGERSLVLFADDNFEGDQPRQVLVFAVRPAARVKRR